MKLRRERTGTLVVQLADLGDLLLAAPAIRRLVQDDRGQVTLLTKPSNRALSQQVAPSVIEFEKELFDHPSGILRPSSLAALIQLARRIRRERFERVLFLHHFTTRFGALKYACLALMVGATERDGLDNGRGWFLTRRKRDYGFGAANERRYWEHLTAGGETVDLNSADATVHDLLTQSGVSSKYIVVHPGSGAYSTARRWPVEHFRQLIASLQTELGLPVVVVGGAEETELAAELCKSNRECHNFAGKTDLAALTSLLSGATLFVGNDGGVAQLASTLAVPSVLIFGPTSPDTWHVPSEHSRAVRLGLPCSPCMYHHHELGTPGGCRTRECLFDLSPALVRNVALDAMANGS